MLYQYTIKPLEDGAVIRDEFKFLEWMEKVTGLKGHIRIGSNLYEKPYGMMRHGEVIYRVHVEGRQLTDIEKINIKAGPHSAANKIFKTPYSVEFTGTKED